MLEKLEEIVIQSTKTTFKYVIDELTYQLKAITLFFDRVADPFVSIIKKFRETDRPSSILYNKYLTAIENDVSLLLTAQKQIRSNILSSWNVVETAMKSSVSNDSKYDSNFLLEHSEANVLSDRITLGVKTFISTKSFIKDKPVLDVQCPDKEFPVFYGKAWGSFIEGSESSEDGVRYTGNDGSLIVDEKDTFWEAEVVVLQETRENTVFLQSIVEKDTSLSVNVKIVYNQPVMVNTIKIRPYNSAMNTYYKLTKVEVSDGFNTYPISINETYIIRETEFILDVPKDINGVPIKISSIYMTFLQESGYYMKYDLAYFRIQNNETWIDILGPNVVNEAVRMGGNFDENIRYLVNSANRWILNYWLPGVVFNIFPTLATEYGNNGFKLIPSTESKRKRYSIGITDVIIGENQYYDSSELVTKPIDIPTNTNTVTLDTVDIGNIYYMLSFDNGMTWKRIIPNGRQEIDDSDLLYYPNKIYINSDLSSKRIDATDTGKKAFVFTSSKQVRLRMVLQRDIITNEMPVVYNWNLKFGAI